MTPAAADDDDRALWSIAWRTSWIAPLVAVAAVAAGWAVEDDHLRAPYLAMLVLTIGFAAGVVLAWSIDRARAPLLHIGPPELFVVVVLFFCTVLAFGTVPAMDYQRNLGAAQRWLAGEPFYQNDTTTHPPPMGLMLAGAASLIRRIVSDDTRLPGGGVWYAVFLLHQLAQPVLLAVLFVLAYRLVRRVGREPTTAAAIAAIVLIASHPLRDALGHNQPSVLVLVLAVAALELMRRSPAAAALCAAAGTVVKLYPAVFVLEWAAARRWRALLVGAMGVAAVVIAFPALWIAWLAHLASAQTIAVYRDASINGTLVNLSVALGGIAGLPIGTGVQVGRGLWALAVLLIGIWMARRAMGSVRDEHRALLIGPELLAAGVLCFPLSWTHHYLFVIPLALVRISGAGISRWHAAGVLLALVMPAADVFPLGLHRIAGTACLLWGRDGVELRGARQQNGRRMAAE
jgi:hypothetical protein